MSIVNLILVIFFYVFVLALIILVIGTIMQRMDLRRKGYSSKTINVIIAVLTLTFYVAVLFLFLNDWAARMLR